MYKLIALDMDGTLLNSDKKISTENQKAIKQAKDAGVTVVLASGRPLNGMQAYLDELDITTSNDFVLFYNGSQVQNVATREVIHEHYLDGKAAKEIALLAASLHMNVHAFSREHGLITPKNSSFTQHEADINKIDITEMDFELLSDQHPIIKVMIVGEPEHLTAAIAKIPAIYSERYTMVQSAPFFLEFLNPNANKGTGVEAIANYLGYSADEVICVGDAENDHHMLKYAGLGVAMENAMEETKVIADFITTSNNNHGVANVINKFILNDSANS